MAKAQKRTRHAQDARRSRRDDKHLTGLDAETQAAMAAMMFDPGAQHLDLNKAEKLRTTALLMAINYVRETICDDAEMYRALRQDGKELVPATVPWVLKAAVEFEDFLLGYYSRTNVAMVNRGVELEQKRANAARVAQSTEGVSTPSEESPSADAVDPVDRIVEG